MKGFLADIKSNILKYSNLKFSISWIKAHTTKSDFISCGNRQADKLAKLGISLFNSNRVDCNITNIQDIQVYSTLTFDDTTP